MKKPRGLILTRRKLIITEENGWVHEEWFLFSRPAPLRIRVKKPKPLRQRQSPKPKIFSVESVRPIEPLQSHESKLNPESLDSFFDSLPRK